MASIRNLDEFHYTAAYQVAVVEPGQEDVAFPVPSTDAASSTGLVSIQRTGSGPAGYRGRFRSVRSNDAGGWVTTFDGEYARFIDHGAREMMEARSDQDGGTTILRSSPPTVLLLRDLLDEEPFRREREGTVLEYGGRETLDGVPTHRLLVTYDPALLGYDLLTGTLWLSVDDLLPRRFSTTAANPLGMRVETLNLAVATRGPSRDRDFAPLLPDGYDLVPLPGIVEPLVAGTLGPDWNLQDGDGRQRSLGEFRGKVLVLGFWASWCGACRPGLEALEALRVDYVGRDVAVLAINWMETPGVDPVGFLDDLGLGVETLLHGETLSEPYHVAAMPTYYVLDRVGSVAFATVGFTAGKNELLRSTVDSLLAAR